MPSVHQRHDSFALICVNLRLNAVFRINGARIMKRWYMVTVVGKDRPGIVPPVAGADRPGIVAQLTEARAGPGLNIRDLESDVAGTEAEPIYIMTIDGYA